MDQFRESSAGNLSPTDRLSERQKQCLALVANGHTSKEIGRILNLSPSTVDNHLSIALERLGVDSRLAAARIFIQRNSDVKSDSIKIVTDSLSENVGRHDEKQPMSPNEYERFSKSIFSIPPLGGRSNNLSKRRRYLHVIQIMLLAVMAFSAVTTTIAGIVHLFSK